MDADPDFRLTDADRTALSEVRRAERGHRAIGFLAIAAGVLIPAVVTTSELGPWWVPALVALSMVAPAVFGVRLAVSGGGTVARVLAGARPTVVMLGTMHDVSGDAPYPWSMTFDVPIGPIRFAHFGDGAPEWLLGSGTRVSLRVFGTWSRFAGVAVVESLDDGRRHWMVHARESRHARYSSSSS